MSDSEVIFHGYAMINAPLLSLKWSFYVDFGQCNTLAVAEADFVSNYPSVLLNAIVKALSTLFVTQS